MDTEIQTITDRAAALAVTYRRERIAREELHPWEVNPRQGELRDLVPFAMEVAMDGGVHEDLHVFMLNGLLTLMAGHRRYAIGDPVFQRSLAPEYRLESLSHYWCKVYDFADERDAFAHLLTMQQGTDPFDPWECAVAAKSALDMGIPMEKVVGVMHRKVATVQLWLGLFDLPATAQEGVRKGKLTLETAEMLRKIDDKGNQRTAVQQVLHDALTGAPMSTAQAKAFIEQTYLKPERWRKEWLGRLPKLKKQMPVADGHVFVEWENRQEYVQGNAGHPQAGYVHADEHIEDGLLVNPGAPMMWGDLAKLREASRFVVAAPDNKNDFVVLVAVRMVKDAEVALAEREMETVLKVKGKKGRLSEGDLEGGVGGTEKCKLETENCKLSDGDAGGSVEDPVPSVMYNANIQSSGKTTLTESTVPVMAEGEADRSVRAPLRVVNEAEVVKLLDVVMLALQARPEAAMRDKVWAPLIASADGAFADVLPADGGIYSRLMRARDDDAVMRPGLRWCLLYLLGRCCFVGGINEEVLQVVRALGIEWPLVEEVRG